MKRTYYFIISVFTIHSTIAMDIDDSQQIFSNDHLKMAYKTCQAFIDFEQSNLDENAYKSIIGPTGIQQTQQNIEGGEKLKEYLVKCEQKSLQPHQLLETLLTTRLQYLNTRAVIIKTTRNLKTTGTTVDGNTAIYGPTRPDFFDKLPYSLKILARTSTDRYQLLNQIILHVWKCINPRELPSNVKTLVRCSPMLWPNLIGEREYLGHPDEAILDYDGENFPYDKDRRLYGDHIEELDMEIQLRNWTNATYKIKTTRYFRSLWDKDWSGYGKIQDLPYPQWLMPIQSQPAAVVPNVSVPVSLTTQDLFVVANVSTPQISTGPQTQISEETPQISTTTLSTPAPSDAQGPLQQPITGSSSTIVPTLISTSEVNANNRVPSHESIQPTASVSTTPISSISLAVQPTIRKTVGAMNSLTSQSPLLRTKYDLLKEKKRKMIDTIFHPSGYNAITFGQFKKLWIKLHKNGHVKENTGSSHKKLVSNDGQVFPIFAHGDGMRYTKNTIEYLREALRESGYSPSDG